MTVTQFDEKQWPDLTAFRNACLNEHINEMQRISDLAHHWYENENPKGIEMSELAKVFQAQHYAAENNLQALKTVIKDHPWTINYPWTAQRWLPITQAAYAHGDRTMINFLLDSGADPTLLVGPPDDLCNLCDMARHGGHKNLASELESIAMRFLGTRLRKW